MSSERHETLMQRLILGELDPSSAEAQAFFAERPEARAEFDELVRTEHEIARATAERQDTLGALSPSGADEDDLLRGFRATIEGSRPRPLVPARRIVSVLATAAAFVLVFWLVGRGGEAEIVPVEPTTLGNSDVCVAPVGLVEEYGTFEWRLELPPGGAFTLTLLDGRTGAVLLVVNDLTTTRWTYDSDNEPNLPSAPERLRWEVRALGPDGFPVGTGSAEAWLR